MAKKSKLTYEIVARSIDNLIKTKANGDKFPTFNQIIKVTGGNANTLNSYIKQYKAQANSKIEILQQQLNKFADTNAKYVEYCKNLEIEKDILTNKNVALQKENELLQTENADLKTQIKNNNAYDTLLNLLKTHSADFKRFEKKFDDINNITILDLQKFALKDL